MSHTRKMNKVSVLVLSWNSRESDPIAVATNWKQALEIAAHVLNCKSADELVYARPEPFYDVVRTPADNEFYKLPSYIGAAEHVETNERGTRFLQSDKAKIHVQKVDMVTTATAEPEALDKLTKSSFGYFTGTKRHPTRFNLVREEGYKNTTWTLADNVTCKETTCYRRKDALNEAKRQLRHEATARAMTACLMPKLR